MTTETSADWRSVEITMTGADGAVVTAAAGALFDANADDEEAAEAIRAVASGAVASAMVGGGAAPITTIRPGAPEPAATAAACIARAVRKGTGWNAATCDEIAAAAILYVQAAGLAIVAAPVTQAEG